MRRELLRMICRIMAKVFSAILLNTLRWCTKRRGHRWTLIIILIHALLVDLIVAHRLTCSPWPNFLCLCDLIFLDLSFPSRSHQTWLRRFRLLYHCRHIFNSSREGKVDCVTL